MGPAAAGATLALALGACGSAQSTDIDEAAGSFPVEVTRASFPELQRVSLTSDLVLTVRNTGDRPMPELAVTVWTGDAGPTEPKPQGSFSVLADDARPGDATQAVWLPAPGFPKVLGPGERTADLGKAPDGGAVAAQTDTFAFGRLEAGASRTMVWRVTAVRAGRFDVHYSVAAGLAGRAKAVDPDGQLPTGDLAVRITDVPEGCVVDDDATDCTD